MRCIRRTPRSKDNSKPFLNLIGKRAAMTVPIEAWSEVANSALRSRTTTRFAAALAGYLRTMRRMA